MLAWLFFKNLKNLNLNFGKFVSYYNILKAIKKMPSPICNSSKRNNTYALQSFHKDFFLESSDQFISQLKKVRENIHFIVHLRHPEFQYWNPTLYEKCPYSEFFWSVFSRNWTEFRPEKLWIWKLFTQYWVSVKSISVISYLLGESGLFSAWWNIITFIWKCWFFTKQKKEKTDPLKKYEICK